MYEWRSTTPDGRKLVVRREHDTWIVRCGAALGRSRILDVALIEAMRANGDIVPHSSDVEYGAWTRDRADAIEQEFEQMNAACHGRSQQGDS
jgi:hypothetical protein